MEFWASKCDGVLLGVDGESIEKLAGLGLDALVRCNVSKKRNLKNHKRYFAFINTAYDMQEKYDSVTIFRKVVQMGAGYFTTTISPKGVTLFIPHSIKFEEMEEEEFKVMFKKSIDYFLSDITNSRGMTNDEFYKILRFC